MTIQQCKSLLAQFLHPQIPELHFGSVPEEANVPRLVLQARMRFEYRRIFHVIDIPIDENSIMTEDQLNDYFNSKKVNKKYRLKSK